MFTSKISANGNYYVVYSIGSGGIGVMTINDTGEVEVTTGSPIYISNGKQ
ncbi:MAG: hypothetical protein KJ732_05535 [Candidatus Margulisbacteria bacterium]|nr:hypothetical protein [Candidatus Margulisiibacteriota bacterium]